MPATVGLYQDVLAQIKLITAAQGLRQTSVVRLALLVTGIIAAQSCVLNRVAAELFGLGLTHANSAASIGRRLRRTLNDQRLDPQTCYAPALSHILDWPRLLGGSRRVVLALDESSKADQVHLLRVSLSYWGGSLPLAWALWEQNQPLEPGRYWHTVETVLSQTAALLPAGVEVVLLADRAYDVPAFIDRITKLGWHWIVRCKAQGSLRYRDRQGREWAVRTLLSERVPQPGGRWKGRGWVFKAAGWRAVSLVAIWEAGYEERLVVLSDLPPSWDLPQLYRRRFWIEPGFRNDKSHGWQWEDSQAQGLGHQRCLVLALAWASLVVLCLGVAEAEARLARCLTHPPRRCRRPEHARESVFTLGLRAVRGWLYQTRAVRLCWHLPRLDAESWTVQWQHAQLHPQSVRP